jgi:hypothetical protein
VAGEMRLPEDIFFLIDFQCKIQLFSQSVIHDFHSFLPHAAAVHLKRRCPLLYMHTSTAYIAENFRSSQTRNPYTEERPYPMQ